MEGVQIADLIDPDRSKYAALFQGIDAVVHLGYKRRQGDPLDHFFDEKANVEMAYNVLRDSLRRRRAARGDDSSNHAADWYEHNLIHTRKLETLDPYALPLSDNFYGWAKATYEHLGFMFACGLSGFGDAASGESHVSGTPTGRQDGRGDGAYRRAARARPRALPRRPGRLQARPGGLHQPPRPDAAIPARHGDAEHRQRTRRPLASGVRHKRQHPRLLVARHARRALGYEPQDDSEVKYADDVRAILAEPSQPGRVVSSPEPSESPFPLDGLTGVCLRRGLSEKSLPP